MGWEKLFSNAARREMQSYLSCGRIQWKILGRVSVMGQTATYLITLSQRKDDCKLWILNAVETGVAFFRRFVPACIWSDWIRLYKMHVFRADHWTHTFWIRAEVLTAQYLIPENDTATEKWEVFCGFRAVRLKLSNTITVAKIWRLLLTSDELSIRVVNYKWRRYWFFINNLKNELISEQFGRIQFRRLFLVCCFLCRW